MVLLGVSALATTPAVSADTLLRIAAANITSGDAQSYDPNHGTRICQGLDAGVVLIQEFNFGDNTASSIGGWLASTLGACYQYHRKGGAQIPNGIISRHPILALDERDDTQVSNRDFARARLAVPGPKDLWVISVHLITSGASVRNTEATALNAFI